ncbi:uncharacterized protein LOC134439728 [Engraulis encrasicolus]|uniref:uncharacterized protein LOC134439728 n=1 Tax=Engraulis encrasicolus TaxID=184585 RepID=UPI002FD5D8DF
MIPNLFLPLIGVVSLANLVTGQQAGIEPARIYGLVSNVKVGEAFDLKCSMFGLKRPSEIVHLYLCKDGVGTAAKATCDDDYSFTVKPSTFESAGNYSCVFSSRRYRPSDVRSHGSTSVYITVIDFLHPALIAVNETPVRRGTDVELKCTSEHAPDNGLLHAYLCRNQQIIDVHLWNPRKRQAVFFLRRVRADDSAHYSCVLSEKLLATKALEMCKNNTVFLEVYDSPTAPTVITIRPEPECNENLFRIFCSAAVVIVLVVVVCSGEVVCRRKDIAEEEDGDQHSIMMVVMEPQAAKGHD